MISKAFLSKSSLVYALFLLMAVVVFYGLNFRMIDYSRAHTYLLGANLVSLIDFSLHQYDLVIFGFILFLLQAIGIAALSARYSLLPGENILPSFVYLLLIAQEPALLLRPDVAAAFLFVNLAYFYLFSFMYPEPILYQIFPFGFLLGVAFLFYPETIFMIVLAPLMILLQRRRLSINDVFSYFFGLISPFYFYATIHFMLTDSISDLLVQIGQYFSTQNAITFHFTNHLVVLVFLFFLFGLFHVYYFMNAHYKVNIRLAYQSMIFISAAALISYFVISFSSEVMWAYLVLPMSLFFSFVFMELKKKWVLEVLFLLFLVLQIMQLYLLIPRLL